MADKVEKSYNPKTHKKCIKCRDWKPREDITDPETDEVEKAGFGKHDTSSDGIQSICYTCKNAANKRAREQNVTAYLRHHIATRCLTQLGELAPPLFTKQLEKHLGYKITALVRYLRVDLQEREGEGRKLRDAIHEGYQVDHVKPLSLFKVVRYQTLQEAISGVAEEIVDWDAFKECWAMINLSAIPGAENLAKGAKYTEGARDSTDGSEEPQE